MIRTKIVALGACGALALGGASLFTASNVTALELPVQASCTAVAAIKAIEAGVPVETVVPADACLAPIVGPPKGTEPPIKVIERSTVIARPR